MKYPARTRTAPHIIRTHHTIGIYKKRWHIFAMLGIILVPFLFFIFFSKFAKIGTASLFANIGISIWRILVSYAISVVLGFVMAVAFYRGRASAFFLPLFDVLQSFPTFALLPLVILYWGASELTVDFFLVISMVWPIFFMIVSSLKLIKSEWYEAVEISGVRGFAYLRTFIFPAAVPAIITGSIVGIGEAWEALIATEIIVGTKHGLGPFFQAFSDNPRITAFGILGVLIIIFSVNKIIWLPLLEKSHRSHEE